MMDILKPPFVWINGSCFRKNVYTTDMEEDDGGFNGDAPDEYEVNDGRTYEDDDEYRGKSGSGRDESVLPGVLEQMDNGRYKHSFHVPSAFFAIVIGKKGVTKKRLEDETRTKITIPRKDVEGENIVVTGDSRGGVVSAYNRISVMVVNARSRQEFTHFLSIPMNMPEMRSAFAQFRDDALAEFGGNTRGLDKSIFQHEGMLHLTIGTMALMDHVEREKASELLQDCKEHLVIPIFGEGESIGVQVKGLEIMNDDPFEADVIFAKVSAVEGVRKVYKIQ